MFEDERKTGTSEYSTYTIRYTSMHDITHCGVSISNGSYIVAGIPNYGNPNILSGHDSFTNNAGGTHSELVKSGLF